MKKADIEEFYRRLQEQLPEPKGELNYVNPYTLLVAVVLSAQATDIGVNKATGPLFKVVTTPEEMVALGEANGRTFVVDFDVSKGAHCAHMYYTTLDLKCVSIDHLGA